MGIINTSCKGRAVVFAATLMLSIVAAPRATRAAKGFATPDEAAEAFAKAVRKDDRAALRDILDARAARYVSRLAPDERARFLKAWDEHHAVVVERPGHAVVEVGNDGWTLPAPLVRHGDKWSYDVNSGREEILRRRIGRNELAAMEAVLAYYDAQKEYAEADRDGNGSLEYAQKLISTPGTRNGLYWVARAGEPQSPLGPLLAGRKSGPYHGYRFKILTAQGPHARGGARDYVVDGHMTNGFALIAWPERYGETGVMTFIVNSDGVVFEKDLGPHTDQVTHVINHFDPDETWHKVSVPSTSRAHEPAAP